MDSLTQAVFGAAMGELVLGRKLGWRGALCGAILGTLPDLDVLALPFMEPAAGIYWHRGISHSILVTLLLSFLLAFPLARYFRVRKVSAGEAGWMVILAWGTHSMVDCFTTYGTQIFEPFSHERVAMNVQFIVDPLFTLPLLVGLCWALTYCSINFSKAFNTSAASSLSDISRSTDLLKSSPLRRLSSSDNSVFMVSLLSFCCRFRVFVYSLE